MKVVSPAMTSVRRFVPRSENLKKPSKVPSPLCQRSGTANIATRRGLFLEAQEGLVLLPEEPGHGGEPQPDYGGVGGGELGGGDRGGGGRDDPGGFVVGGGGGVVVPPGGGGGG